MLVSAFIAGGPPRLVLEAARRGAITLIVPELAIEELIRVLTGKLGADGQRVRGYVEALRALATIARIPDRSEAVSGDRADDAILACAVAERADVLVTGDRRHLLPLGEHGGVLILTPQALLAELAGS
ncbi:MAG: PIN domain-containing protein [Thermoleophilaceae bacterium]|nr:PIN domain-containing protein [Thermoleophilaceae bacterium]